MEHTYHKHEINCMKNRNRSYLMNEKKRKYLNSLLFQTYERRFRSTGQFLYFLQRVDFQQQNRKFDYKM